MALKLIISGNRGPAGAGFPGGGDAGTVLVKASSADYDTEWTNTLSLDTLAAQSIISNTLVVDSSSMSLGSATLVKSGQDLRVYTLPNRDGTFALLTGPQTFSGNQAFSSDISVGGNAAVTGNLAVTGNASIGGVATFANGSASDPSIKFSGSPAGTGFCQHGLFGIQWAAAGIPVFRINGGDGIEIYGTAVKISSDIFLLREAANALAQRNGTSAQSYRLYNTFTDSSNYERAVFAWSSNTLRIGTEKAGTGTARGLALVTDGTTRFSIASNGTGTYSGNLAVNGSLTIPNQVLAGSSSALNRSLGDGRYARPGWHRTVRFALFDQESTANGGSTGTPTSDLYISATTGTANSGSAMRYTSALRPYLYSYPGNGRLGVTAGIDWSKNLSVHLLVTVLTASSEAIDPATEIYWRVGENRLSTTFGPNTTRGVGLYMIAGKIVGMVHDGTSLTTGTTALYEKTTSGAWPVLAVEIRHIGGGNYQFWVNGALMDTLTGGPITPGQQENIQWAVMARNGSSGTQTCTAFIITEPELCYH